MLLSVPDSDWSTLLAIIGMRNATKICQSGFTGAARDRAMEVSWACLDRGLGEGPRPRGLSRRLPDLRPIQEIILRSTGFAPPLTTATERPHLFLWCPTVGQLALESGSAGEALSIG